MSHPPTIAHGESWDLIPDLLPEWPRIDCLLTDPPYGMDFQSTYGKDQADRELYQQKIDDDVDVSTAIVNFDRTLQATRPFMEDVCEIYVFCDWKVSPKWQEYLEGLNVYGIRLMQMIVWDKGYPGLGDFKYNWGQGHELIYYLKVGNRRVPYRRSGIVAVDKVRPGTNIHPTEKPTRLLNMLIEYSTVPGQFVFDPYAGSGSTVLAASQCNRAALGIEKKEQYVLDARKRLPVADLFSTW